MTQKIEFKLYDNMNRDGKWELEKQQTFKTMWELAYGANKQQSAGLYKTDGMANYEILSEGKLTYNEIISITELSNVLSEFYDVSAVAIVDHAAPCAVALAPSISEAYNKAFDCENSIISANEDLPGAPCANNEEIKKLSPEQLNDTFCKSHSKDEKHPCCYFDDGINKKCFSIGEITSMTLYTYNDFLDCISTYINFRKYWLFIFLIFYL